MGIVGGGQATDHNLSGEQSVLPPVLPRVPRWPSRHRDSEDGTRVQIGRASRLLLFAYSCAHYTNDPSCSSLPGPVSATAYLHFTCLSRAPRSCSRSCSWRRFGVLDEHQPSSYALPLGMHRHSKAYRCRMPVARKSDVSAAPCKNQTTLR